jgi:hypothetical protein
MMTCTVSPACHSDQSAWPDSQLAFLTHRKLILLFSVRNHVTACVD